MFSQKCIPTEKFAVLGAHRNTTPAVWYDWCVTKCAVVKGLFHFFFFSSTEFHNSSRYRPFFTEVFHRALSTLRCTSSYFNFDESLVRVTCLGIGRPNITRLAKDLKASLSMNFLQNETNAPRSSLRRTGYEFLSNVETNSPRSARRFSDFLSPLQLGLR